MKTPILLNHLQSAKKSMFFWSLALAGSTVLVIALFDSMSAQYAAAFEDAGVPAGFEAFLGDTSAFSSPAGWLGIEMFSLMLPISLAIIGIGTGASAIGREENNGTLELLLSSPVSRGRILLEKFAAVSAQLAIICLVILLSIIAAKDAFDFNISISNTALATLSVFLVGLVFASISMMVQAITGKRGLAIGVCSGLLITSYFIDSLAPLVDSIDNFKYASAFYYYEGQEALIDGITVANTVILSAASAAFVAAAYFGFRNRDIDV